MKSKICFIVAIPSTAITFLKYHIEKLSDLYDVYLVANQNVDDIYNQLKIKELKIINIERSINLFEDFKAVLDLYKYFVQEKFVSVHSVTPKAGLLTSVAARLAGINHRIHIYTGQVWANKTGYMRFLLKSCDRMIALLNNHILVDGEGQRQFLISNKIISEKKSRVLGVGSISGVNIELFNPQKSIRDHLRNELNIKENIIVFSFMGRLNKDKGVSELLEAYNKLAGIYNDVFLVLFGRDENDYVNEFGKYHNLNNSNFLYYGITRKPYESLQISDVFVLPTYREGFGSSLIEASCLGLPVICSDIYGVKDAVIDDVTGLKCLVADADDLFHKMQMLYSNKDLRFRLGKEGRKRVLNNFSAEVISSCWVDFYKRDIGL